MKKILLDVFGSDHPEQLIAGAAQAVCEIPGFSFVMTGKKEYLEKELFAYSYDKSRIEIVDAPDVITNNDSPAMAVMQKPKSSLSVAMRRLHEDSDAIGAIAAGNTGAVLSASVLLLGRLPGLVMPALTTMLPTVDGKMLCMLDCGANVDCQPQQLLQFARMGSAYIKAACGIERPRVALVSIGTEDKKGNTQTKAAFPLLQQSELNFVGNMETRDAMSGEYDVLVCDGFIGNILLKSIEGTARFMMQSMGVYLKKQETGADITPAKAAMKQLMSDMDFNSKGGGILLGAQKLVIKVHGSANANTVINTVKQLNAVYSGGYDRAMREIFH